MSIMSSKQRDCCTTWAADAHWVFYYLHQGYELLNLMPWYNKYFEAQLERCHFDIKE